jgi:hypothetical protein
MLCKGDCLEQGVPVSSEEIAAEAESTRNQGRQDRNLEQNLDVPKKGYTP